MITITRNILWLVQLQEKTRLNTNNGVEHLLKNSDTAAQERITIEIGLA
ncbi:MAG TPA: hypothetical protein VM935_06305 [Chitinophagaceae bacterium]|nr:hypothetical protein [Chitinophagaceae bacterium]